MIVRLKTLVVGVCLGGLRYNGIGNRHQQFLEPGPVEGIFSDAALYEKAEVGVEIADTLHPWEEVWVSYPSSDVGGGGKITLPDDQGHKLEFCEIC